MGVLEDAIREHLDLRRRQGVTDEELRRQEDEALGPARREKPVAEAAESAEPEGAAETALLEPEDAPVAEAPPTTASTLEPEEELEPAPEPEVAPAPVEDPAPEAVEEGPPAEHPEAGPVEPAPPMVEAAPPVTEPEPPPTDQTAIHEPSPDFTEEAPEQEGLPSEERPRRDLDFD